MPTRVRERDMIELGLINSMYMDSQERLSCMRRHQRVPSAPKRTAQFSLV